MRSVCDNLGPKVQPRKSLTFFCCAAGALLLLLVPANEAAGAEESVRLRIAWGSQTPIQWRGSVTPSAGALDDIQVLNVEPDLAGATWLDGGTLNFRLPAPRRYGDLCATFTGPSDAVLQFEIAAGPDAPPISVEATLEELKSGRVDRPLGEGQRLVLQRVAGDALRILSDRAQFIFAPGEEFQFELETTLTAATTTVVDYTLEVSSGRGGEAIWSDRVSQVELPSEGVTVRPITIPLPTKDGVYTVTIRAIRPSGFGSKWLNGGGTPVASRSFQVVVLGEERPEPPISGWRTLVELDPANPHWWARLPEWARLRRGPWARGDMGAAPPRIVDGDGRRFVELRGATSDEQRSWHAYPLSVAAPGVAHVIELEYPLAAAQTLQISVLDTDPGGQMAPLGADVQTNVREEETLTGGVATLRRVFWPTTTEPVVVISNPSSDPARFGKMRVRVAEREAAAPAEESEDSPQQPATRFIAARIATAHLAAALGASRARPVNGATPVDDWQAFYEAATRLADYLELNGYNGAVLDVAAEGSALFPSQEFGVTPRFDQEIIASQMADVPQKDVLELLLRVFDRRGLRLAPAIRFDSPLPALESARRAEPGDAQLYSLVNGSGQSWRGAGAVSATPLYNPLDPVVQRAMVAAVDEVVSRYHDHKAFHGVAVDASTAGFALLPGDGWGYDQRSVDAFLQSRELTWPADTPRTPSDHAAVLYSQWRPQWRAWRAERVTAMYSSFAKVLVERCPDGRLLLLTDQLAASGELAAAIRPKIGTEPSVSELLLAAGIDAKAISAPPNVQFAAPRRLLGAASLAEAALDVQANAVLFDAISSAAPSGAVLLSRRAQRDTPPLGSLGASSSQVVSVAAGAGMSAPYVRLLATQNPAAVIEGGVAPALTADDGAAEIRRLLARAPMPSSAVSSEHRAQPATARCYSADGSSFIWLVNNSPWEVETIATFEAGEACQTVEVHAGVDSSDPETGASVCDAGTHVLKIVLAPYEVRVHRFSTSKVKVTGVITRTPPEAINWLKSRVADLRGRDLNAPRPLDSLMNASFEEVGEGPAPAGWGSLAALGAGMISTTDDAPQDGQSALRISANGAEPVAAVSRTFQIPETGQLAISFYLRSRRMSPDARVEVAYETADGGVRLSGAQVPGNLLLADDSHGKWIPYLVPVDGLPLEWRGDTRLRFQLVGGGEVDIDHVVLQSLLFSLQSPEMKQEQQRQKLALIRVSRESEVALNEARYSDCMDLLDSYWSRFLMEYTPRIEPQVAKAPADKPASVPKQEDEPSISERMREYLPGFLRR